MTGHQINSLVGDLVAMAQAMERLPQVEAEVRSKAAEVFTLESEMSALKSDLEQSRSYAASLEAKVHAAEASRDDAELRFLELDERHAAAIAQSRSLQTALGTMIANLEPLPQPEPIISEVKPIAADPTDPILNPAQYFHGGPTSQPADHSGESVGINPQQGQSEPDPTHDATPAEHSSPSVPLPNAFSQEDVGMSPAPSWATPTPPNPAQPYAGHNYYDWPADVSYDKWIEGGGTHNDYYQRRHPGF